MATLKIQISALGCLPSPCATPNPGCVGVSATPNPGCVRYTENLMRVGTGKSIVLGSVKSSKDQPKMASTGIYSNIPTDMVNYVYREPAMNKYKSRTSYVVKSTSDPSRARYQMATKEDPRLKAPYGISKPFDEKQQDSDRKSLDLNIESDALLNVLVALDEHNVKVAFDNCEKWFGKKLPIEHIKFMYRPIVTYDKNKKYKPTFRTKINVNANSDSATRFFLVEEKEGQVEYLEKDSTIVGKGSRMVPIIEPASLWFSSTQFGMTMECTDVIVFPGTHREDFPFHGWGQAVPMEVDAAGGKANSTGVVGGGSNGTNTSTAGTNTSTAGTTTSAGANGWVPPTEPHAV